MCGDSLIDKFTTTDEKVVRLKTLLDSAFEVNKHATVRIDAHEKHAAPLVAWLSHKPIYHDRTVVIFYTYGYNSGSEFALAVNQADVIAT
ncbi:hypothetical protein PanWU01x14_341490 [Parasponia andersonii]|uniref:Uncharacterized protein n=1 Tax=Parasponia andersonii TaxID=3476 RepID=A0A2P5AE44_PARAD|nr:hypothetical protein PanWU01x14_341490 [Parasponia andersonii]